ncbi:Serine/threonine protein kinase [Cryptosporidium felis]|nr:Serine/threonine protein kinase [Cryptosporidium felis]
MTCTLPLIKYDRELQQDLLLNNYDVLWDVDLGGSEFCRVKLGVCRENGELVAVKIVTKTFTSNPEKDVLLYIRDKLSDSFSQSKLTNNKNNSEYFPKVFDVFEDIDFVYIVMELSFGGELFHLLVRSEDKLSEGTASLIFSQICNGIKILHSIGIVHGDIKAENIVFSKKSRLDSVQILDFGNSYTLYSNESSFIGNIYKDQTVYKQVNSGQNLKFNGSKNDNFQFYQKYFDFWSCGKLLYLMLTKKYLNVDFQECLNINDIIKRQIFESDELEFCSDLAKDLLYKLLSYSTFQNELLTMDKILLHPWFNLAKDTPIFNCYIYPHDELAKAIS